MSAPALSPGNASFRSLVLPREHGSWSLALEPVALGLLVAPTLSGASLAIAVVAAFFARRPLKLAFTLSSTDERRRGASAWLALFATTALGALLAIALAPTSGPALWPLLLAVPFGAAFLWFDLRNEMREAEAELAGSAAFALVPAAFATLAGWSALPALALAFMMLGRSITTVLAVRAFLRARKGQPAARGAAWASAWLALGVAISLAYQGFLPAAAPVLAGVFLLRTATLLLFPRSSWTARGIGMTEAAIGVAFLVTLALAYRAF